MNVLRKACAGPRWLLRRAGFDIIRYPPFNVLNIRRRLERELAASTKNTIAMGPFSGVRLPSESSWGEQGPKLLGCYEQELHPYIEEVIAWQSDVVLNVGCAEGYYAVGLAKRLPAALVVAYDVDANARKVCEEARDINGIKLEVRGFCTCSELRERSKSAARPFLFIDCEGGERELLLSGDYGFPNARLIVECHDFIDRRITSALIAKFSKTHRIVKIIQGSRDPFSHPSLVGLSNSDRWTLVSEWRPETMHWLYMTPRCSGV